MAVDVQLEDHIRKIEGLAGGYLRSPQDEATRQALLAELEKFGDQTARADAYSDFRSVLVRYQVPRSWVGRPLIPQLRRTSRVPSSKHRWLW